MSYECALCRKRGGKTWPGSDPICAFKSEGGQFSEDNWNCATVNEFRVLAEYEREGVVVCQYCEHSQSVALIDVYDVDFDPGAEDYVPAPGFVLWLTWYKSRGKTEGMWLMGDLKAPVRPTEAQCLAILNHYGVKP